MAMESLNKQKTLITYIVIVSFFIFNYSLPSNKNLNKRLNSIHLDFEQSKIVAKLYLEYCLARVTDRKQCLFSKPFFKLRKQNGLNIKSDLGTKYLGTKHYIQFYKKLGERDPEVQNLPSYKVFNAWEQEQLRKAYLIHKEYNLYSKGNKSFSAFFLAVLTPYGVFQLICLVCIFYFFGPVLESAYGRKNYVILLILGSGIPLVLRRVTLEFDSIEYIKGASFLGATLLGAFWARFYKLSFHHIFPRLVGERITFKVRYYLLLIFTIFASIQIILYPQPGGFQYFAFSFFIGAIFDFLSHKVRKIPSGFINEANYLKWEWIKENSDHLFVFTQGVELLKTNPFAFSIKIELLESLKKENIKESPNKSAYYPIIDKFIFYLILEKDGKLKDYLEYVWEGIFILPYSFDMEKYFKHNDINKIRSLILYGIQNKYDLIYIIKFIEVYLLIKKSWDGLNQNLCNNIFINKNKLLSKEEKEYIQYLFKSSRSILLRDFIRYNEDNLSLDID